MSEALRILYVGQAWGTCAQRAEALRSLGHHVEFVASGPPRSPLALQVYRVTNRLRRPADFDGANRRILELLDAAPYDLLWIDKGVAIRPATLRRARDRRAAPFLLAYSPDDMLNPGNHTAYYRRGLPLYDLHVTTKSYNVAELEQLGAREVFFIDKGFDPATHRPLELDEEERRKYATDVSFVGMYERDRAEQMLHLAQAGVPVTVWGGGWRRCPFSHPALGMRYEFLDKLEYSKAINGARINLAFLCKANRDLQTARSVEIPACGAFMLAERTDEHLRLFAEGREAEYFSTREELVSKCRYYLAHDAERRAIARAGRERCLRDRYGNPDRLGAILAHVRGRRASTGAPDHLAQGGRPRHVEST